MTAEEARKIYGSGQTNMGDGYVNCYRCPLEAGCSKALNGRDECWSAIAAYMTMQEEKESAVDHPAHYNGKYECIDVMIDVFGNENAKGFCICNAFKYIWRCQKKHGNPAEDIEKAIWYMEKYLELEGKK
jgi:hypothetical protein